MGSLMVVIVFHSSLLVEILYYAQTLPQNIGKCEPKEVLCLVGSRFLRGERKFGFDAPYSMTDVIEYRVMRHHFPERCGVSIIRCSWSPCLRFSSNIIINHSDKTDPTLPSLL
jgi:hypothetical protein